MEKTNRLVLLLVIFVAVLGGSRWYFAPKKPAPASIAQVRTVQQVPVST